MNHEEENASEMDTGAVNLTTVDQRGEEPVHRPAFSGWSQSDRSIQSVITSNIASLSGTKGYMKLTFMLVMNTFKDLLDLHRSSG